MTSINNFLFKCIEDDTQIRIVIEDDDIYIYGPTGLIHTQCSTLVKFPSYYHANVQTFVNTNIRFLMTNKEVYLNSEGKKYVLVKKRQKNRKLRDYKITKDTVYIFIQCILKYIKTD